MPTILYEYVTSGKTLRVNRDAGVIEGVKVLGLVSANKRRYLREAVEKAKPMYEGRVVNCDHASKPGESRSARDRLGWLRNVRVGQDGLYGDLHYLRSHPLAAPLAEAAERNPRLFGLSHHAVGRERREGSQCVIEEIENVISVDVVADPATSSGLFEGRHMRTIREQDGAMMAAEPMSMADHIAAMVADIVRATDMDKAMKLSKIRKLLDMLDQAEPAADENDFESRRTPRRTGRELLERQTVKLPTTAAEFAALILS